MGVPAFFRWLSRKYPSIIVSCVEDKNVKCPEDLLADNPNGIEFDNVYLDMNGIIHPCCHPENKAAPENEDEMMIAIFEYIDRLLNILRPRKLLYMAIDGVAPRAKMNQQRSRRFRAAQESTEKAGSIAKVKKDLLERGIEIPDKDKPHFDSNCITPGTPFMFRLSKSLQYYIQDRMSTHAAWKKLKVILSDANVPGEGEHKIMDYIRKQRANPDHDPNTRHCLCGADADLIMLGLATHEPHFTIIREEFKPNQTRPCDLCGESDHELKDCQGGSSPASSATEDNYGDDANVGELLESEGTKFLFIRLDVLREYLEKDLAMPTTNVAWDFERLLDDWVFMCFFVGNDFLPHLPSLEIRENAIDRLIEIYKKTIPKLENYLSESGKVNLNLVQHILLELGELEDAIFKQRQETELRFQRKNKDRERRQANVNALNDAYQPLGGAAGQSFAGGQNWRPNMTGPRGGGAPFKPMNFVPGGSGGSGPAQRGGPRGGGFNSNNSSSNRFSALTNGAANKDQDSEEESKDDVRLWETGFKDRYYSTKFRTEPEDIKFRNEVAKAYARGLCWVLLYYYQGCPAWNWFFPYHYAPFASDFTDIGKLPNDFEIGTEPFKPLEQLMAVFPEASSKHVPPTWAVLMKDPKSPIIDFYPENFCVDLNGKRWAWQGVALLPFVEEGRLLETLQSMVYPDLTDAEKYRNCRSFDRLYIGADQPSYEIIQTVAQSKNYDSFVALNSSLTGGMGGSVKADPESTLPGSQLISPIDKLEPIKDLQCIGVFYKDPQYPFDYLYSAKLLPKLTMPPKILKPSDWDDRSQGRFRPSLGFRPSNSTDPISRVNSSGHRALSKTLGSTMTHNRGLNNGRFGTDINNNNNNYSSNNNNRRQGDDYSRNSHIPYSYNNLRRGGSSSGSHYNADRPSNGGRYQNLPMDYDNNRFGNNGSQTFRPESIYNEQPYYNPYPNRRREFFLPTPADSSHLNDPDRFSDSPPSRRREMGSSNRNHGNYQGGGGSRSRNNYNVGNQRSSQRYPNLENSNFNWQQQMLHDNQTRNDYNNYPQSSEGGGNYNRPSDTVNRYQTYSGGRGQTYQYRR